MLGFRPVRVAGQPAPGAQRAESVRATGDDLVHVRLMPGVEHDRVPRRVENQMQRNRQFDDAEIRAQVPTALGCLLDQELPDFPGQGGQLFGRHGSQVGR
jgi:hypothetical protein